MKSTFNLDLYFCKQETGSGFDYPPFAQVRVKYCTSRPRGAKNDDRAVLLTSECKSQKAFDAEIDHLIGELEIIRKQARRKFIEAAR